MAGATTPASEKIKYGAVSVPAFAVEQPSVLMVEPSVHTPHFVAAE